MIGFGSGSGVFHQTVHPGESLVFEQALEAPTFSHFVELLSLTKH
jgi:hypothetical protein